MIGSAAYFLGELGEPPLVSRSESGAYERRRLQSPDGEEPPVPLDDLVALAAVPGRHDGAQSQRVEAVVDDVGSEVDEPASLLVREGHRDCLLASSLIDQARVGGVELQVSNWDVDDFGHTAVRSSACTMTLPFLFDRGNVPCVMEAAKGWMLLPCDGRQVSDHRRCRERQPAPSRR